MASQQLNQPLLRRPQQAHLAVYLLEAQRVLRRLDSEQVVVVYLAQQLIQHSQVQQQQAGDCSEINQLTLASSLHLLLALDSDRRQPLNRHYLALILQRHLLQLLVVSLARQTSISQHNLVSVPVQIRALEVSNN